MRRIKEIVLVAGLTIVAALGLAACGGNTAANTPVAATSVPTTEATAVVEQPTTEPTAVVEQPTVAPTVAIEQPTTAPTAAIEQPTTEATTAPQATTGTGGGITVSGPGADLLSKYVQAFKAVQSYHIVQQVEVSGQTITQEGDFQAPDNTRLTTDLGAAGKLQTIIIGTKVYQQTPGGDSYTVTDSPSSAVSDIRNTDILQYVDSANVVGDETVNGIATTHLSYVYDADKLMAQLSPGTVSGLGKVTIDVWIDKATSYPVQQKTALTVTAAGTTMNTTTTQTYSKYNETVDPPIVAPTNATQAPSVPTP